MKDCISRWRQEKQTVIAWYK